MTFASIQGFGRGCWGCTPCRSYTTIWTAGSPNRICNKDANRVPMDWWHSKPSRLLWHQLLWPGALKTSKWFCISLCFCDVNWLNHIYYHYRSLGLFSFLVQLLSTLLFTSTVIPLLSSLFTLQHNCSQRNNSCNLCLNVQQFISNTLWYELLKLHMTFFSEHLTTQLHMHP